MRLKLLLYFLLLSPFTFGQGLNVDKVYDFSPSKLTRSEQEKKGSALDEFWNRVKSDTTKYLPLLRTELIATTHHPFFYYDGAALLLSVSKKVNDKVLAAKAIAKCDIADIEPQDYVTTINGLSNDGINVTSAAVKILQDTSFKFFLPQHAMYFTQGDCLAYMLLPQTQRLYVDTLVSLFKGVDPKAQKSIITTLWLVYSCKGDSLIKASAGDNSLEKEVSKFATNTIKASDLDDQTKLYLKKIDKAELAELRKKSLQRFSDEALDELTISTLWLRKNENWETIYVLGLK